MKYTWIDGQRTAYPLLGGVRDAGRESQRSPNLEARGNAKPQAIDDALMLTLIWAIYAEFKGAYGSPRMAEEIRGRDFSASKESVERLMRENGIRARHKRRFKARTDSKHGLPVAPNLFDRNFTPTVPNQVWPTSGRQKVGPTWPWCLICSTGKSSTGP